MDLGGDAMDHDTSLLTRLKEEARLRHQHAADSRNANGATSLKIKMIVSNWYKLPHHQKRDARFAKVLESFSAEAAIALRGDDVK